MKNNKGMTLTEIIICVVLVSIIFVFLLNLLITVKKYSDNEKNASNLLINQSVLTKEIQKDFNDYKLTGISSCTPDDITKSGSDRIVPVNSNNIYCLKFTYANNSIGYLLQYSYKYSDSGNTVKRVIGYKRGTNQVVRESYVDMDPNVNIGSVETSCTISSSENCGLKIKMPITDSEGNDYSIELSYIYKSNEFNYSNGTNTYGFIIK